MNTATELKGIIVPVVTPVTEEETVDYEGLRRVVRHVLDGGVHGVFAMGGTGNFCSFTAEQRFEAARAIVREVGGKVPVLVGAMDSSTPLVIRNAQLAREAGADAIVVEPPFYYPCTEDDVISHYKAVAEAAQVPVVIYNIPEANKVDIDVQLTKKLAAISGIIGIKDSTSDFVYFQELLSAFSGSGFRLIQGQETLAGPSFLLGAHGAILAIGNVIPRLCVELFEVGSAGKLKETSELHTKLLSVFEICKQGGDDSISPDYYKETVASFFTGLHCALDILGLCKRVVTVPFPTPSPDQYERVRGILARTGVVSATS
jgi:4-hydroxy-tetrahydrodipicolinate synthase